MAIKLSALYITKNEEQNLARSLASLDGQADELIVVDTGSTDNTVRVAKQFGATVYHYDWQDDFAAARNYALSKATGDYVLFLDADEYFVDDTAKNIQQVIARDNQVSDGLLVPLTNIDEAKQTVLDEPLVLRLFKRQPQLAYQGRIHEELRLNGKLLKVAKISQALLHIYHTGYSAAINKQKSQRNLNLLLQALKAMPATGEPTLLYRYLAESYSGLNDEVEAVRYAELDINQGRQSVVNASRSYHIILAILARYPQMLAQRLDFATRAVKDFPDLPEFYAELAQCYILKQNYHRAIDLLQQALAVKQPADSLEPNQFNARERNMAQEQLAKLTQLITVKTSVATDNINNQYLEIPTAIMKDVIKAYSDEDNDTVWQLVKTNYLTSMRKLVKVILELPLEKTIPEAWITELPSEMATIVACYRQEKQELKPELWDSYTAIYDWLSDSPKAVIRRYVAMAKSFAYEKQLKFASKLVKDNQWLAALSLYQAMPAELVENDADFWYNLGVCLYSLQLEGANKALTKARQLGAVAPDIEEYLSWSAEEKEHD